jgi:hypothetical protein
MFKTRPAISEKGDFLGDNTINSNVFPSSLSTTLPKMPNLTKIVQYFPLLTVKSLPKWTDISIPTDKGRDLHYTLTYHI